MYDPISEKFCDYNLKFVIDTYNNTTTLLISDKANKEYKIVLPMSTLSVETIFEIANDFVKNMCVNTIIDVSDYF